MSDPRPMCKLCHQRHWLSESHGQVTRVVTDPPGVTKRVTVSAPKGGTVTLPVTEVELIIAATQPEHECPICGLLHGRPKTNAERQRAYRERKATK